MFGLNRSASLFWLAVCTLGVGSVVASGFHALNDFRLLPAAILFGFAGAAAEAFSIQLPSKNAGQGVDASVSAAVYVAAILVFPVHWAVLIVAAANASARLGTQRTPAFKVAFNVAQIAVSAGLAGAIWGTTGHSQGIANVESVPWALLALTVYFCSNTLAVSTIVSLASSLPIRVTWWRTYRNVLTPWLAMLSVGMLVAVLWTMAPWSIALAAVPLAGLYYALRNSVSLQTQTVESLFNLADILDARDPYTHGHSLRVGEYAQQLAIRLGASIDEAQTIFLAGRLHDIGKCAINNEVLRKPGPLTSEEHGHMCQHAEVGGNMLAHFALFKEVASYVRGHHERWDGKGYPDRLVGEEIPWGSRVIAVADSFDAMTTDRPYRRGMSEAAAIGLLSEGAGTQWDARVVEGFLDMLREGRLERTQRAPLPAPHLVSSPVAQS